MRGNWHRLGLIAAGAALLWAGPVWGQQRSGESGRALDANPRAGSGGVNEPVRQPDYQRRNDIVTGNVSGGFQFRDRVDYGAPNEFRDQLGSDDLFEFRARSLPSAPGQVSQPDRRGTAGGPQSVYRSFSGQPGQGRAPQRSTQIEGQRLGQTFNPAQASQGQTLQQGVIDGDGLGIFDQQQPGEFGALPELEMSPLLGVRQREQSGLLDSDDQVTRPQVEEPDQASDRWPDEPSGEVSRLDLQLRPTLDEGQRVEEAGLFEREVFERRRQEAPGSFLGRQIQGYWREEETRPQTLDQRIQQQQDQMFGRLRQRQPAADDAAYQNVLEAMEAPRDGRAPEEASEPSAEVLDFEEPGEETVAEAERQRRDALAEAFDLDDKDEAAEDPVAGRRLPAEPGEGKQAPEDPAERRKQDVAQMLEELDYDMGPLQTLAGQQENRVNEAIQRAEQKLNEGEYFTAERLYRQLVTDAPNRPLLRAGLVHAQLGAGMIRSAALNLRSLFDEHPEVIAVRYGKGLLPPDSRLQWIQQELQRMIQEEEDSPQPGLMLAYLGHQVESRQLVRYGLATAASRSPKDPLLPVLRRIWLDEPAGETEDEAPASEQAPPPDEAEQPASP